MIHSIQISTAVLQRLPAMIPHSCYAGRQILVKDISVVSLEALGKGYLTSIVIGAHSESWAFSFFMSLLGSYL